MQKHNITIVPVQRSSALSYEEMEQERADRFNSHVGELEGYDCAVCKNRGYLAELGASGDMCVRECDCKAVRRTLRQVAETGINKSYGFDNFKVQNEWQQVLIDKAKKYVADPKGWFYVGGQVGAGKTHVCSAIFAELVRQGYEGHYMLWSDEGTSLKATVNDVNAYRAIMKPLMTVKVLYIDDFLKTKQGEKPTTADINLAFKLLNARYNNPDLLTIISSERYLGEVRNFDDAVGSRIYEKTQEFCVTLGRKADRNYRMKDKEQW